jgi:hypothetical protein
MSVNPNRPGYGPLFRLVSIHLSVFQENGGRDGHRKNPPFLRGWVGYSTTEPLP